MRYFYTIVPFAVLSLALPARRSPDDDDNWYLVAQFDNYDPGSDAWHLYDSTDLTNTKRDLEPQPPAAEDYVPYGADPDGDWRWGLEWKMKERRRSIFSLIGDIGKGIGSCVSDLVSGDSTSNCLAGGDKKPPPAAPNGPLFNPIKCVEGLVSGDAEKECDGADQLGGVAGEYPPAWQQYQLQPLVSGV